MPITDPFLFLNIKNSKQILTWNEIMKVFRCFILWIY